MLATFEPKPEFRDEIRTLLQERAAILRNEPILIEAWRIRQLWMIRNDAETVKKINAGVELKLLKPVLVKELKATN
jgi:quinol monooxygenase YgiN